MKRCGVLFLAPNTGLKTARIFLNLNWGFGLLLKRMISEIAKSVLRLIAGSQSSL
jgi:hypothetical protein